MLTELPEIHGVISQYLELKKQGPNYRGLCPFHLEKTPSFTVSPQRQKFKCFGCGVSGNVIDFIKLRHDTDFKGAMEMLKVPFSAVATMPQSPAIHQQLDQRLLQTCVSYWTYHLKQSPAGKAYLNFRGITNNDLIQTMKIGYAPRSGLFQALTKRHFSADNIFKHGVCREGRRGPYDHFRERLIFPVIDREGRITTITSRSIYHTSNYKHLHLPGDITNLYNESALDGPYVIVVEGILDALALLQAGFRAVAAYGTGGFKPTMALKFQDTDLKYFCFDAEPNAAGHTGSRRAIDILSQKGINNAYEIRLPSIPGRKTDVNDFFHKFHHSAADFKDLMKAALSQKEIAA